MGEIHISQGLDWESHYSVFRIYSIAFQRTNENTRSFWITVFFLLILNQLFCLHALLFFLFILSSTLLEVEARKSLTN